MTPSRSRFLGYFVRHRTAANLVLLAMVVAGVFASLNIRAQFFPDFVRENVTVNTTWRGAGPEDVDASIIAVMEPRLLAIEGVVESRATATEGRATIRVDFEDGWDMGRATEEVKTAVDGITTLPENADEPKIYRGAFRDRVTDVVISGPTDVAQLTRFATEFQARLFRIGVTRTEIQGVSNPVIRVSTPEASLMRHDVSIAEIASAIGAETEANPAGDVGPGGARVRAGVAAREPGEIGSIAVRTLPDGSNLLVRDLAEVELRRSEEGVAYFRGEHPAVVLRVDRAATGDSIEVQRLVEGAAEEMRPLLPDGVDIILTRTRAQAITDRLDILVDNGLVGLGLVLVFLFLFLNARTAFWVSMGIPVAMIATVGLMWLFGLTLNMISLFALIICLGVVVDDAIVVAEHTDFLASKGLSPADAAETAAVRMWTPVFAASLTTIIAFSGLTLVGGFFGSLVVDIPYTVIMVLIASLVESFIILPAHMRHALRKQATGGIMHMLDAPSRFIDRGFSLVRERVFKPAVRRVLQLRYPVIGVAIGGLLASIALVTGGDVPWRFFNAPERGTVDANIAMLPGATREDTRTQLRLMQEAAEQVSAEFAETYGAPPVEFSLATLGGSAGWRGIAGADAKDPDLLGGMALTLIDPDLRPYSQSAFIGAWQDAIRRHPKLETLSLRGGRSGGGGDAIDVQITGASPARLKKAAEAIKTELAAYAEVTGLEDSLAYDKTELVLTLTPRGQALGFTVDAVGRELRNRLSGVEAAEFPFEDRSATVEVALPEAELTADYLDRALIAAPGGGRAALSEIVDIATQLGFSSVRRENGFVTVNVTGEVSEDDPEAAGRMQALLADEILPSIEGRFGVGTELGGAAEDERAFLSEAALGFLLCVLGIYLCLAWVFASWTRPLAIVLIIPLGAIGMILGHWAMSVPLSMFSVVGFIGMAGIIVNDAIVLTTTVDEYAENRALTPAMVDAVGDRLRPVFLTTATTVAGLAPLLFEASRQAQFLKPTVITLCFGLGIGMFVVLLVTPALIAIQRDIGATTRAARRSLRLLLSGRRFGRPESAKS